MNVRQCNMIGEVQSLFPVAKFLHGMLLAVVWGLVFPSNALAVETIQTRSCATATCHGGVIDQGPSWNHSSSSFYAFDPHRSAGQILTVTAPSKSRNIVERLNPAAASDPSVYDQVLVDRCVSCHTSATTTSSIDQLPKLIADGIGCASCHGDSSSWVEPHTRADFVGEMRFQPPYNLVDTESIAGRAATCVRCHVGSRTDDGIVRDVNHDLIAAGHPAMRFDLLIFNENLPHHWDDDGAVEREFTKSAMRTRAIGQKTNLFAAAKLSAERAEDFERKVTACGLARARGL